MTRNIQLVIPMSGIGKRFIEAGYTEPKPLIKINNKSIIDYVVNLFPNVNSVLFICNEEHIKNNDIEAKLRDIVPNCTIVKVSTENRRGPVDAVYQAREYIDDTAEIIVSYCDYGTVWDFEKFISTVRNYDGMIPCYTGFHPHMLGSDNYAFCKEEDRLLIQIKEKEPFTTDKMSEYASNGTYYFKSGDILKRYFKEAMDAGLSLNGEYYVSLVYNLLVRDGLKVGIFEIEKMLQWGTPYDLEVFQSWLKYFKEKYIKQKKATNPVGTVLVLPMAGRGSRFSEQNYKKPKPLLDIDGSPMVVQAVNCLPKCSSSVFICLEDHLNEYNLREELHNNFTNTTIVEINETTSGQACTCEIGICETNIDSNTPIQISACDNGVTYNETEYQQLVNDETVDVIVWSFRNNQTSKVNPNMYSWLQVDEFNNITNVSCKKFIGEDPLKTHAIIGTMFFRKARYFSEGLTKNYNENITTNDEYYVDDIINQCVKAGLNVKVFEVSNYICWGTPDDYQTYNYWKEYFESTLDNCKQ